MWKKYLKTHSRFKQESFLDGFLNKHLHKQFERMTPLERWNTMSLIENNKLVEIEREKLFVEEFEEQFEDTIYQCEHCGSKQIDLHQVQTRGAVSVLASIIILLLLILFFFQQDESMTCFQKCVECGFKWTEN